MQGWGSKQQQSISKQLNKIQPYLQQVRNEHSFRLVQSIWQILSFYLGTTDSSGILQKFGNEFANYQPVEWARQLQKLLQHILPGSPAFNQILKLNKDPNALIIIPTSFLPQSLDLNSLDHLRFTNFRIVQNGIQIPPLDAFFMMLSYAIYQNQPTSTPMSQFQHLYLDQFYSSLSRNPLLVLLRKNIEYCKLHQNQVLKKIIQYLRLYLMDQLIIKYQQDKSKHLIHQQSSKILNQSHDASMLSGYKKSIQLKYRMKTHHFHTIYLMLNYGIQYLGIDFNKYCSAILLYYSELRPDIYCLQAFIRIWIYSLQIKNNQNIQNQLIKVLQQNANSKQGWFYLKRYSPQSIFNNNSIGINNIQTLINILKLLQKQSNWVINTSYLYTFACLFRLMFSNKIYYNQLVSLKNNNIMVQSKQNTIIQRIIRIIVSKYNGNIIDIFTKIKNKNKQQYRQAKDLVENYQQIIQNYYRQYSKSKNIVNIIKKSNSSQQGIENYIPIQYKFIKIKDNDLLQSQQRSNINSYDTIGSKATVQNKQSLVSFYRSQPKGCWEIPIQYNQSLILYYMCYSIAKIIDLFIPGKRTQPLVNIRFLANPITFLGVFIVFLVIGLVLR